MTTISPPAELINSALQSGIIIQSIPSVAPTSYTHARLHYIPIILFLFFPTTFLLCYFIALSLGHINAFFAFISDAGTVPPEQNVFAQLVNVGAALFAYFVYIRYIQVEQYMKKRFNRENNISNAISLAFGFVSALGMSLVGNFPELVEKEVHLIGAFLSFVGCSIYCVFQGYFTFKLLPHFQTRCVAYVRVFLGILGLMLYFGSQSTIVVAFHKVKNKAKLESNKEALKWLKEDGGYTFRAASVIMEWLLLVMFDCFMITFISEFKKFKLAEPEVTFLSDICEPITLQVDQEAQNIAEDMDSESDPIRMTSEAHVVDIDDDSMYLEDDYNVQIIPTTTGGRNKRNS